MSSAQGPSGAARPRTPSASHPSSGSQERSSFFDRIGSAANFGDMPSNDVSFKFGPSNKQQTGAPAAPAKLTQPRTHSRHFSPTTSPSASGGSKNTSYGTNQSGSTAYSKPTKPIFDRAADNQVALKNLLGTSVPRKAASPPLLQRRNPLGQASPPVLFKPKQPTSIWAAQRSDTISENGSRPTSSQEDAQMDEDDEPDKSLQDDQSGLKSLSNVQREPQAAPMPPKAPRGQVTTHTSSRPAAFSFKDQPRIDVRKRGIENVASAHEEEPRWHKVPAVAQKDSPAPRRPPGSSHGAAYMPPLSRPSTSARDARPEKAAPAHRVAVRPAEAVATKSFGMNEDDPLEDVGDLDEDGEITRRIHWDRLSAKKRASIEKDLENKMAEVAELKAQRAAKEEELASVKAKARGWIAKAQKAVASANEFTETMDTLKNDHVADRKRLQEALSTIHELRQEYSKLSRGGDADSSQNEEEGAVRNAVSVASLYEAIEHARASLQLCEQLQIKLADTEELRNSEREKATQALYDRAEVQEQLKTAQSQLSTAQDELKLATQAQKNPDTALAEAKANVAATTQKLRAEEDAHLAATALANEKEKRLLIAAEHEEELNATIQDLRASAVQQQTDLDQQRTQVEELRKSLSDTQSSLRVAETNLANDAQSLETLRKTLATVEEDKRSLEKDNASLKEDKRGIEICLSALQMAHDTQTKADKEQIGRLQIELEKRDTTTVEAIRESLKAAEQRNVTSEAENARLKMLNDTLQPQVAELQGSLKQVKSELEDKTRQVVSTASKMAQMEQDKARLVEELTTVKLSNSNATGRVEQIEQDRDKVKAELEQAQKIISQLRGDLVHAAEQGTARVQQLEQEKSELAAKARTSEDEAKVGRDALQREQTLYKRWQMASLTEEETETIGKISQELVKPFSKDISRKENEIKKLQHDWQVVTDKLGVAQTDLKRARQNKENPTGLAAAMQKRTLPISSESSSSPSSHANGEQEVEQLRRPIKVPAKFAAALQATKPAAAGPPDPQAAIHRNTRTYPGRTRSSQRLEGESSAAATLRSTDDGDFVPSDNEQQQAPPSTEKHNDDDAVTNDDDSEVSSSFRQAGPAPKPLSAQRSGRSRSVKA